MHWYVWLVPFGLVILGGAVLVYGIRVLFAEARAVRDCPHDPAGHGGA